MTLILIWTIFSGEMETQTYTNWIGDGIDINDVGYVDEQYRVVVTTTKGTTVETIADAFNT